MESLSTTISIERWQSDALEVHLLGLVDFDAALFLQKRLQYEISGRNDLQGCLLVCEHPPLMTLGREGTEADILVEKELLDACEIDVRRINRGGGTVIHAPGQLAVYPVLPLDRLDIGLAEYRHLLRNSITAMCNELQIPVFFDCDEAGMLCRCGEFAQIGVAIKSWTTYHGFFINVTCDLELQQFVQPSSSAKKMTSLSAQLTKPVSMSQVRESIIRNLAHQLKYDNYHLYTSHPLLKRTKKKIVSSLT